VTQNIRQQLAPLLQGESIENLDQQILQIRAPEEDRPVILPLIRDRPLDYPCTPCGTNRIRVACEQTAGGIRLNILGTPCNDLMEIWSNSRNGQPPSNPATANGASARGFECRNGTLRVYGRDACQAGAVSRISIWGYQGNDRIDVSSSDLGSVKTTVLGAEGDEHIRGGRGDDTLYGGAGNDIIDGKGGDDRIYGNEGRDHLWGGTGDDWISGDNGADHIDGGLGNDTLLGGRGDDHLIAGDPDFTGYVVENLQTSIQDLMFGNDGDDCLWGKLNTTGRDLCFGNDDEDRVLCHSFIAGGAGNDILATPDWTEEYTTGAFREWSGNIVHGETGDDDMVGASGHDTFYGGPGDDCANGFLGRDHMVGGGGHDTCLNRTIEGQDWNTDTCANDVEEVLDAYETNPPPGCRGLLQYDFESWCETPTSFPR